MKININQLEKADTLPFRIGHRKEIKTSNDCWRLRNHYYHSDYNPWKTAKRIIKNNIGKSFSLAFSYFCSKFEQRYYNEFLELFKSTYRRFNNPDYYIDDNGLIQTNIKSKEKKEVIFTSSDYKTKLAHKDTKHWFDNFYEVWTKKEVTYTKKLTDGSIYERTYKEKDKFIGFRYKGNGYWATNSNFERIVVQGTKTTYSSKNDPKYIRYITEKIKKQNLEYKRNKKIPKLSDEDFRRLLKEKELKEKQLNLIKIESHGFDLLTSFRKLKTN